MGMVMFPCSFLCWPDKCLVICNCVWLCMGNTGELWVFFLFGRIPMVLKSLGFG